MKDIPGFEGLYAITRDGRVWSHKRFWGKGIRKGKWLKQWLDKQGYFFIVLCCNYKKKNASIHRLVAQTYIPNPKNYKEVNHLNGNHTDNRINNLEWTDRKGNAVHAAQNGLLRRGAQHPWTKISDEAVVFIRAKAQKSTSNKILAEVFKVRPNTIARIKNKARRPYL